MYPWRCRQHMSLMGFRQCNEEYRWMSHSSRRIALYSRFLRSQALVPECHPGEHPETVRYNIDPLACRDLSQIGY